MIAALALAAAAPCTLPSGWDAVAASGRRYIVLGELHGTAESPAFVGELVCGLVTHRERVLVALEQDSTDDAALQEAWRLPPARFPAALLTALHWRGRNDGNASVAMRDLLVGLHGLKARGATIDLVAFNGARDESQWRRFSDLPGQGPHEAAQAENIRRAADAAAYDHVVVLVGNLHAARAPVDRGGAVFQPMAMRLAPPAQVLSFDLLGGRGTAWTCQLKAGVTPRVGQPITDDVISCGPHAIVSRQVQGTTPRIALGEPPESDAQSFQYDGYVWLGPLTASPPAVP